MKSSASVPAFSYLLYNCLFCSSPGTCRQTKADWRSKQMCTICYRSALLGWRNLPPKDLLSSMQSDPKLRDEFNKVRQQYVEQRKKGVGRVRLPAASVVRANAAQKDVEDAPYRFFPPSVYKELHGRTGEEDGLQLQHEYLDGNWVPGFRVYEWYPRVRRIIKRRRQEARFDVTMDAGTADGGEAQGHSVHVLCLAVVCSLLCVTCVLGLHGLATLELV